MIFYLEYLIYCLSNSLFLANRWWSHSRPNYVLSTFVVILTVITAVLSRKSGVLLNRSTFTAFCFDWPYCQGALGTVWHDCQSFFLLFKDTILRETVNLCMSQNYCFAQGYKASFQIFGKSKRHFRNEGLYLLTSLSLALGRINVLRTLWHFMAKCLHYSFLCHWIT